MLMQFLAHPSILPGLFTAPSSNYVSSHSKCQSQDNRPTCSFIFSATFWIILNKQLQILKKGLMIKESMLLQEQEIYSIEVTKNHLGDTDVLVK